MIEQRKVKLQQMAKEYRKIGVVKGSIAASQIEECLAEIDRLAALVERGRFVAETLIGKVDRSIEGLEAKARGKR